MSTCMKFQLKNYARHNSGTAKFRGIKFGQKLFWTSLNNSSTRTIAEKNNNQKASSPRIMKDSQLELIKKRNFVELSLAKDYFEPD